MRRQPLEESYPDARIDTDAEVPPDERPTVRNFDELGWALEADADSTKPCPVFDAGDRGRRG